MTDQQEEAMGDIRFEIANHGCNIEDICARYKVPMPLVTIICRDPDNDKMYICISNEENAAGIAKACELALSPPAKTVTP